MATKTWTQTSGNLASTDANWSGGAKPLAGDAVVFDNTSDANCTWDLALELASYTQAAGYDGIVTVAASTPWSTTGDITIASGTLTSVITSTITCGGNLVKSGGTITAGKIVLIMSNGGNLSINASTDFYSLRISGDTALIGAAGILSLWMTLTVDLARTLTLTRALSMSPQYAGASISNLGTIAGTGIFTFAFSGWDFTTTFGLINAPVVISIPVGVAANRILTLGADTVFGSTLSVYSSHASNTLSILAGASNRKLTVAGLVTLGNRGIFTQGTGAWTFGSLTQNGVSSVITTGGPLIVNGATAISDGAWAVNATSTVLSLNQTGGAITVAVSKVLYYITTLAQTGGTSSGTITQNQGRKTPIPTRGMDVTRLD